MKFKVGDTVMLSSFDSRLFEKEYIEKYGISILEDMFVIFDDPYYDWVSLRRSSETEPLRVGGEMMGFKSDTLRSLTIADIAKYRIKDGF